MMTKTVLLVSLAAFATVSAECRAGYYGDDCNQGCSPGCKTDSCDSEGVCKEPGCILGWEDQESGDGRCGKPICFGDNGCAEGGKCVAPNYCVCGEAGAQTVGIYRDFDGIEGTNCVNLRTDGLIGCVIAFIVLGVSISFCGLVAEKRIRSKKTQ